MKTFVFISFDNKAEVVMTFSVDITTTSEQSHQHIAASFTREMQKCLKKFY